MFNFDPFLMDRIIRIARRIRLLYVIKWLLYLTNFRSSLGGLRHNREYSDVDLELMSIRHQLHKKNTQNGGVVLLLSMNGVSNILLQLPIIAGIVASGLEPVLILGAWNNKRERDIYRKIGVNCFSSWDDFGECTDFREVLQKLEKCKTQDDVLKIKWKGVSVGKYAVSTLMRQLRIGSVNPSDDITMRHLMVKLRRTLDNTYAALALLRQWQPETVIFIDRGYMQEGPMFEACISRGIQPITMNASHKDNALILKRYEQRNTAEHPASLSTTTWAKIRSMPWSAAHWNWVRKEIENCYQSGQWYGEVATQFKTELIGREALQQKLGLDRNKQTVLLFPHIFWDATFFWGIDLFQDYETWFRECVRIAWKTSSVNWIIKVHPANIVKNIRDGSAFEFSEINVIKEFGKLPSHIHVIPADTNISTLSLYSIGDICLTVRGTVGIEAAAFGLSVVTAGTGRYDRLGFTIDPDTIDDYCKLIENIVSLPSPSSAQIDLARRYAYGVFLVRPLEMDTIRFQYEKTRKAELRVSISSEAKKSLFSCRDVVNIRSWLESGEQDFCDKLIDSRVSVQ